MKPFDLWAAERLAALTDETGWLNLIARIELVPGRYTIGAGACDLVLPAGPADLGVLELGADHAARLITPAGEALAFAPAGRLPAFLRLPPLILEIHAVDGAPALRVRLIDHPGRAGFAGIDRFPPAPDWVINAEWRPLDVPETRRIDLVRGHSDLVTMTHRACFSHAGHEVALVPTYEKGGQPMFVIRDATSGRETYGPSRFLVGEVTGDRVLLDFNRLHNPPCAYTDFAVCPLPPPENRLPFAIPAGELKPKGPASDH